MKSTGYEVVIYKTNDKSFTKHFQDIFSAREYALRMKPNPKYTLIYIKSLLTSYVTTIKK